MKKNRIIVVLFILLTNTKIFAQMTVWNNTAFVVLEAEDYNERIKKPQLTWNNTYYAVGIEGNVISDEMLRTYLFSYMDLPDYFPNRDTIEKRYSRFPLPQLTA